MSHFSNTHRDGKEMKLWQEVHDITYESTVSDLGASLLELVRIKTEYPKYNRLSRKVHSLWYLQKSKNEKGYTIFNIVPDDMTLEKLMLLVHKMVVADQSMIGNTTIPRQGRWRFGCPACTANKPLTI